MVISENGSKNSDIEERGENERQENTGNNFNSLYTHISYCCSPDTENAGGEGISDAGNIAVVYFSAQGHTETVARAIADTLNADIFEIEAAEEYTSDDLNWNNPNSRVSQEENHESVLDIETRPGIASTINLTDYDTVFLGYPIWWGHAPSILLTFIDDEDLSGKTIIPFCTSLSSGIGNSARDLESYENDGNWLDGMRFSSGASENSVRAWLLGLGF